MLIKITKFLVSFFLTLLPLALLHTAAAVEYAGQQPYYFGIGAGQSILKSDTLSSTLKVKSDNDFGYRVFTGYQIDQNISVELFWSGLGSTGVSSNSTGNVVGISEYHSFGVGGMYRHYYDEAWQIFGTTGIGMLNNNVQFIDIKGTTDDNYLYIGLGAIWEIANTWEVRAEYDFYNSNAQLLSVNIVKQFGGKAPE